MERDGFELSVPRQRISVYRVNPLGCFRGIGASFSALTSYPARITGSQTRIGATFDICWQSHGRAHFRLEPSGASAATGRIRLDQMAAALPSVDGEPGKDFNGVSDIGPVMAARIAWSAAWARAPALV